MEVRAARSWAARAGPAGPEPRDGLPQRGRGCCSFGVERLQAKKPVRVSKIFKILQIFSGLVLGCIKTKVCKKICVRQQFSSSTRFAYFCTAAISKFSQKNRLEKSAIFVKIQQNFAEVEKCKMLQTFQKFS